MDKIYFYDLGIRNMLIHNFNFLDSSNDVGHLWENFLMVERKKKLAYEPSFASTYFWRTYTGVELDYIEETGGELHGFEFKYAFKKIRPPKAWLTNYKNATFHQVNKENFLDFVM